MKKFLLSAALATSLLYSENSVFAQAARQPATQPPPASGPGQPTPPPKTPAATAPGAAAKPKKKLDMSAQAVASRIEAKLPAIVRQELADFRIERDQLVERVLIPGGVRDPRAVEAIRHTPRHTFVPDGLRDQAYLDKALPIGEAQTISSPYIVAVMTEALQPDEEDSVLEIGTGSGYQAAVLSPLVKHVYTIEIVEPIGLETEKFLQGLGYTNIHTRIGDGYLGWAEHAPYQKIIVTCSPEEVPTPLVEQLAEGGLMVIPVGKRYQQLLHVFRKVNGKLVSESTRPTLFVPMTGQAEEEREDKEPRGPELVNGDFEAAMVDGKFIPGWYYDFNAKLVRDKDSPAGSQVVEFSSQNGELPSSLIQGFRLDGRITPTIQLRGAVSTENVVGGAERWQVPIIQLRLLDENREELGTYWLGPYVGTRRWKMDQQVFRVHPRSREALIQIGLFGATGTIRFDGISVEAKRR